MDNKKLEKLHSLLSAVNNSLTKQEFIESFKAVSDYVKRIENKNNTELQDLQTKFSALSEMVKSDTANELDDFKSRLKSLVDTELSKVLATYNQKIKEIDTKLSELKDGNDGDDGKDADEELIIEEVTKKVVQAIVLPDDSGEVIVEKINKLEATPEYQIDFSHIKNAPESSGSKGSGLRNVFHDTTMTGTGTAVDPLRVVSSPSVAWGSITGTLSAQTDLQDALDGKVNTPISTTRENLYDTLIAGSLLEPEQWYLITNYQTEDYVQSSNNEAFYSAPVEEIYVKAATTSTLYPTAFSKDYPDEQLIFTQDIPDSLGTISGYYQDGTSSGNNLIDNLVINGFDQDVDGNPPSSAVGGLSNNGYDGILDSYYDIASMPAGKFVTNISYNGTTNDNNYYQRTIDVASAANLEVQLDLADLTWSDYANDNTFYLHIDDVVNSMSYDFYESDIGVNITISSAGLVTYIGPNAFDATGATVYGTWQTTADGYSWSALGVFSLLHRNNFDFTNILTTGYINTSFQYLEHSYYGRITKRHNLARNLEVDIDYRGYKFRRYELSYSAWSAGTYSAGQMVSYNNSIYMCMYSTNTVPGAINSLWALLCSTGTKISPYAPIQIKGFSITKNSAVYADYDMFASGLPIDVRIFKANQDTTQLDAVFHTTPNALTLRSNGASLTVFGTVSNCDFDLSSSVALRIVGNSTGRIAGGFVYEMTSSNVGLLTITYVKNLLSADMGTLSYSALLSTAGSSLVTLISNSVIAGGLSGSTIASISNTVFKNSVQDCFIQSMSNCVIDGFFFSNVCLGAFSNCTANNYYANTNYTTVSSCSFEATSLNIFFGTVSNSTLTGTVSNNKFFKNLASVTIGSGITYANNETYAGFAGTTFVSVSLNRYTVADGTTFQPYAGLALINSQTNTQAAGMLTINSPLGTSDNGAIMKFVIKCTNPQYLKWNANYTASPGLILPFKTTGGNQTDYYTFQYNNTVGWILLSSTNEFTSVSTQNLNAVFSDGEVISYDNDMVFY